MATHHRVIFPVGHGGFAFENIGNTNVIFDCGSDTTLSRVEMYIDCLIMHGVSHIDYLFISHFDKDHVNALKYLINSFQVKQVFIPFVPKEYRIIYNRATLGAYREINNVLQEARGIEVNEVQDTIQVYNPLWEWNITNMLTIADLANLSEKIVLEGLDMNRFDEADYVTLYKDKINRAMKKAFGALGPNSKGLVVLSQKIVTATVDNIDLWKDRFSYRLVRGVIGNFDATDCLYVGDANLSSAINVKEVQDFITKCKAQQPMLLMQIPHHGSRRNMRDTFNMDFPSKYYFVNDINRARIRKKKIVYQALKRKKQLLVVRESCRDLIFGRIEVH